MATKVTILGEQPIEQEKKKIEFCKWMDMYGDIHENRDRYPSDYAEIILIQRRYRQGEYDLMIANNPDDADVSRLFLGHFNDGIV